MTPLNLQKNLQEKVFPVGRGGAVMVFGSSLTQNLYILMAVAVGDKHLKAAEAPRGPGIYLPQSTCHYTHTQKPAAGQSAACNCSSAVETQACITSRGNEETETPRSLSCVTFRCNDESVRVVTAGDEAAVPETF